MLLEGEAAEHRLTNTSHALNTSTLKPEDAGRARGARGCSFCAFAAGHGVRRHAMLRSSHSMQRHRPVDMVMHTGHERWDHFCLCRSPS